MRMIAPTDSILALLSLKSEPELFIWRTINSDFFPSQLGGNFGELWDLSRQIPNTIYILTNKIEFSLDWDRTEGRDHGEEVVNTDNCLNSSCNWPKLVASSSRAHHCRLSDWPIFQLVESCFRKQTLSSKQQDFLCEAGIFWSVSHTIEQWNGAKIIHPVWRKGKIHKYRIKSCVKMSQSEPFYEAIFTPQLLENTFSPKSEKLERKIHFYTLCYCLGGYWCEGGASIALVSSSAGCWLWLCIVYQYSGILGSSR